MAEVEQAVFTSARTDRSAGYQLVGRSPGVCEADARHLAVWGPSHDALLDLGPEATSINFHPLPSGAYCVSRTTAAGWEYSGRGGQRVYTQCLIVPPHVLERFANNPFAIIRAAMASGALRVFSRVPHRLEPVRLAGTALPVDQELLAKLAVKPGPQAMAALVQAARDAECLAVAAPVPSEMLFAGLLSCLPPECRRCFPLSTGLKFSSRRPFRVVALSGDHSERLWVAHQANVTVIDLADREWVENLPLDGWAQWIRRALAAHKISFLSRQLSKRRFDLTLEDLPALGLQLLEQLESTEVHTETGSSAGVAEHAGLSAGLETSFVPGLAEPSSSSEFADPAIEDFSFEPPWPDEVPGEGFVDRPIVDQESFSAAQEEAVEPLAELPPDARVLLDAAGECEPVHDSPEASSPRPFSENLREDSQAASIADDRRQAARAPLHQAAVAANGARPSLEAQGAIPPSPAGDRPDHALRHENHPLGHEKTHASGLHKGSSQPPGAEKHRPTGPTVAAEIARQRAHAAHQRRFETAGSEKPCGPSKRLKPDSPEVLERLEQLDDVVYEALDGQTTALEELETLWPEVLAELGEELVAESREQYLRYALQIWEHSLGPDGLRNAGKAAQALDVLCILFGDF